MCRVGFKVGYEDSIRSQKFDFLETAVSGRAITAPWDRPLLLRGQGAHRQVQHLYDLRDHETLSAAKECRVDRGVPQSTGYDRFQTSLRGCRVRSPSACTSAGMEQRGLSGVLGIGFPPVPPNAPEALNLILPANFDVGYAVASKSGSRHLSCSQPRRINGHNAGAQQPHD
jgi:hypothetical protein